MPNQTEKLGLVKPLKTEKYDVEVFNGNFQKLDDVVGTQLADMTKLGTTNQIVNKVKAAELKVDTRNGALSYDSGNLKTVTEKDNTTTVKATTLNYDASGNLVTVVETAGGTTVTTTLIYASGNLSGYSKAVI